MIECMSQTHVSYKVIQLIMYVSIALIFTKYSCRIDSLCQSWHFPVLYLFNYIMTQLWALPYHVLELHFGFTSWLWLQEMHMSSKPLVDFNINNCFNNINNCTIFKRIFKLQLFTNYWVSMLCFCWCCLLYLLLLNV